MDITNGIPLPAGLSLFPIRRIDNLNEFSYVNGLPDNNVLTWNKGLLSLSAVLSDTFNLNDATELLIKPWGLISTDNINSNISLFKILNGDYILSSYDFILYGGTNGLYKFNDIFKIAATETFKNLLNVKLLDLLYKTSKNKTLITDDNFKNNIFKIANILYDILTDTVGYFKELREEYSSFNISTYSNAISFCFAGIYRNINNYLLSLATDKINIDLYLKEHEALYYAVINKKRNSYTSGLDTELDLKIISKVSEKINIYEYYTSIIEIVDFINEKSISPIDIQTLIQDVCYKISASINMSIILGFLHSEHSQMCKTELYFKFTNPNKFKNII